MQKWLFIIRCYIECLKRNYKNGNYTQKNQKYIPYQFFVAQAAFESANFQSDLAKRANNFIGMRVAKVRPRAQAGETTNDYARYLSGWQCAKDLFLWCDYNGVWDKMNNSWSLDDYCLVLQSCGYYEASYADYFEGVDYWFTREELKWKSGIDLILFVVSPTTLFMIWYVIKNRNKLFSKWKKN